MFSAPYPDCCLLTHHDGIIRRGHFEGFLNKDRIDDANSREANDQLVSYIENGKISPCTEPALSYSTNPLSFYCTWASTLLSRTRQNPRTRMQKRKRRENCNTATLATLSGTLSYPQLLSATLATLLSSTLSYSQLLSALYAQPCHDD